MARPTDTSEPRDHWIRARITSTEKRRLTALRGGISESDFVRGLVAKAAKEARLP